MKTLLQKIVFIALVVIIYLPFQKASAQTCGAGYTKAAVNFDMQYFSVTALPTSPVNFMFGKNTMRFAWSGAANNILTSINATHTGEAGSLATGNDMEFAIRNGADTMVFENEVTDLRFSVYDIDSRQVMTVTAYNAAGTALNIGLARVVSGTLTITGNGTVSAVATADGDVRGVTETHGTANVTIAGPVKRVVLTFTRSTSGNDPIWISDIAACNNDATSGTWATDYQSVSTPEAGQPAYVLASYNDSIMVVDITNNISALLYRDLSLSATGINSVAVDPYNQYIYYSDNARLSTNRSIYRYDVKRRLKTTWIADVTTLGVQLFSQGMGSGGASFYDGALFIGTDQGASGEPIAVYRIDIDASGNPVQASRFFSKQGRSFAGSHFDWADFVINDGVFYNFNFGAQAAARTTIMHFNLNIMDTIVGYSGTPRSQLAIDYSGNIYHMTTGGRELYNGAGGYGPVVPYTGTTSGSVITDAGEAFKYPYDYGDAPSTYGRAFHLYNVSPDLMLGSEIDYQLRDTINTTASADDDYDTGSPNDEDGIAAFPTLTTAYASYAVTTNVSNTTGADATLYGYIDFNGDGDFTDANERSLATTVPDAATTATVTWTGLSGLVAGGTYARFRIATVPAQAANAFGYGATGEVEDYPITIEGSSLPVELVTFNGNEQEDKSVLLTWRTAAEWNNDYFDVLHSENGIQWESIGQVNGNGNTHWITDYSFVDEHPFEGITYYMLKQVDYDRQYQNSPIISVRTSAPKGEVRQESYSLFPNPARNDLWIRKDEQGNSSAFDIEVYSVSGEKIFASTLQDNLQKVDLSEYQNGMYFVKIGTNMYKIVKE